MLLLAACGGSGGAPATDPSTLLDAALAGRATDPAEPYWSYRLAELTPSPAEAEAHLDTALVLAPDYAPAVALLSKLHYQSGHHQQAVTLLADHLARNAEAHDALRAALALNLDALGAWEAADAALADCRDDAGPVSHVRTYLGLRGDDMSTAALAAHAVLAADPSSAANHNNHGIALLYDGRPAEAKQAFLDALDRDDRLPGALYNLAIVETFYFYDEEEGRRWFSRYRELASEDPDGLATELGLEMTTARREEQP